MSTITRELAKLFRKITNSEIDAEGNAHVVLSPADSLLINNARIALASLEAEPVCVIDQTNLDYLKSGADADVWPASRKEMGDVLLYRTAPPAPVSVPDERYQHLSELYHAQEKRLFKLAQRIKGASFDKYAYSPSQAIDVLESAIFGEREDECRAAMLQGADGTLTNEGTMPVNQLKPVADLYGLTSPTGGETSFTFDAVEARDFIDGGWSCQEYVELGRFQEAMLQNGNSPAQSDCCPEQNYIAPAQDGNSPVIPDSWVACSERMPDGMQTVITSNGFDIGQGWWDGEGWNSFDSHDVVPGEVTHWMPLPAAPHQEA
ncbi:Protein of uncharacterised function (DUF551) [Enterobacter hormaechei]|uniref:DUF551 domain-containing protein n=1 Tax=Enterobacter hormaechei TaxID=158836 RepID=UPI0007995DFB|nr:DUF551 domain-containing protein [Enterobacter hormaechei]SAE35372.1 Protein of uncharacterised function (DUF551) [Enterobacter hormaechei]SAG26953.1 Protein of uncharacterised function (DUF551) [Enterobacter hormaechei]